MKPRQLFDMEKIRSSSHQTVLFKTTNSSQETERGLVLMKLGPALLVEHKDNSTTPMKNTSVKAVIHERQVLETGLNDSFDTVKAQNFLGSSSMLKSEHRSKLKAGSEEMTEISKGNEGQLIKTTFSTTSGKFSVDLDKSAFEMARGQERGEHAGVLEDKVETVIEGPLQQRYSSEEWKDEYFKLLVDKSSNNLPIVRLCWSHNKDDFKQMGVLALDQSSTFKVLVESPYSTRREMKVQPTNVLTTSEGSKIKCAATVSYSSSGGKVDLSIADEKDQFEIHSIAKPKVLEEGFVFEIHAMNGSRRMILSASSRDSRDMWMDALNRATRGDKRRDSLNDDLKIFDERTADVENVETRDLTHWTWYDAAFGPHLLRYVLTTRSLNEFDAQRNSIHQVQEMHKVHELQGIEKVVDWDIKNSYINAYFIFIMYVHLTLTKTITGAFICTEQPHSGDLTLDEHPEMICWSSREHQRVVAWAQFFLLVYALGLPLFIVYKLREIFRNEREFDPSMRARYGYLYFKYTTEAYLWEIVILGRKVFIAIIRMFTKTATYFLVQSSGALIVLAILLVLHILWQPYNEPFLNHMESAALTNHVFVLFIGIMFQSGALGEGDDRILSPFTFALFVMASIMVTFFYLLHGILKELKEMGIINMAAQGASAIVLENYGRSVQKLRRTARGHWCFRPLGNCCNKSHGERGHIYEEENNNSEVFNATPSQDEAKTRNMEKEKKQMQERKKRQHYPPRPLVTHRHHCTTMIGSVLIAILSIWVRIIHMQTLVLSVKRGDLGAKPS